MDNLDKPEWNMAVAFLQQLDRRRDDYAVAYKLGDFMGALRVLKIIFHDIMFKMDEDKELETYTYLEETLDARKYISTQLNNIQNRIFMAKDNIREMTYNVEPLMDEIKILLEKYLYKYGLKYPKQYSMTIQEIVAGEYE